MSQKVLAFLQREIEDKSLQIEEFKCKFDSNPAYALSWSNETFKTAAELCVLKRVVAALEAGKSLQSVMEELLDGVLHASKFPSLSTSPTSNLIDQYMLAAQASLVSDFRVRVQIG